MKKIGLILLIIICVIASYQNANAINLNECSYSDHTVPCKLPGSSCIVLDSVMGNAAGWVGYYVGACYKATDWYDEESGRYYTELSSIEYPIPEGIPEGCAYYHSSKSYLWLGANSIFGGFGGANFQKDSGFFGYSATINDVCSFPTYCDKPTTSEIECYGQFSCSEIWGGKCDHLFKLDEYYGVPSYLNECTDTTIYGSYHQCTEYASRYLHYRFGTDYTDVKNTDGGCAARNTQGFKGYDFHPNYAGNPPKPWVDKTENGAEKHIPLTPVVGSNAIHAGDIVIVIDTNYQHTAVVKSVDGATVTLIEQNWLSSGKYTIGRTINTPKAGVYFYRFPSVYATGSTTPAASIQAASDSLTTNGQTVSLWDGIIKEDVTFTNNVLFKLIGGYEPTFTSNPGWTVINGSLIFKGKAVTVERICIQ